MSDSNEPEHHVGVIGGSGLYAMSALTSVHEQLVRTPFGDPSDAVILGSIGATRFYFLPRHGRGHRLSPTHIDYRANIDALKRAGVTDLVSVSAVGSHSRL